jgi:flotillin
MASKIESEQRAELEAAAKAQKARIIVDAEAKAEQVRLAAQAEAAATFAKLEAQARGEYEILAKKAEGLQRLVEGCGGAQQAFQLLLLEHLPQMAETAAKAIANVKFDKVVVWDGGAGTGGKNATAGFLQGLAGSLPPLLQMMRDIGGVEMPAYFGKLAESPQAMATMPGATAAGTPATSAPGPAAPGAARPAAPPKS